ncbi:hypothetical protein EBZ37_14340, partial [bacterium]|nr:hypothetical protein [bacterium]
DIARGASAPKLIHRWKLHRAVKSGSKSSLWTAKAVNYMLTQTPLGEEKLKPKEAPQAKAPTPAVTKRPSAEQAPKPQVSPTEKAAREMIANPVLQGSRAAGNGRIAFEKYMGILQSDPALSDSTLRRFLNSGPYANNSASYRSKIDGMTREQLLGAVAKFLDGTGPYTHCPSCNLGAGGRLSR